MVNIVATQRVRKNTIGKVGYQLFLNRFFTQIMNNTGKFGSSSNRNLVELTGLNRGRSQKASFREIKSVSSHFHDLLCSAPPESRYFRYKLADGVIIIALLFRWFHQFLPDGPTFCTLLASVFISDSKEYF